MTDLKLDETALAIACRAYDAATDNGHGVRGVAPAIRAYLDALSAPPVEIQRGDGGDEQAWIEHAEKHAVANADATAEFLTEMQKLADEAGAPVAWRVLVNRNGRRMFVHTEQLPFSPLVEDGVKVLREPEPLYLLGASLSRSSGEMQRETDALLNELADLPEAAGELIEADLERMDCEIQREAVTDARPIEATDCRPLTDRLLHAAFYSGNNSIDSELLLEAVAALEAASLSRPSPGVVKLEWYKSNAADRWMAEHPFGEYEIIVDYRAYAGTTHGWFDRGVWHWVGSLEAAQSACQSDFERRILSALSPSGGDPTCRQCASNAEGGVPEICTCGLHPPPTKEDGEPIRNEAGETVAYRDDAGNVGWVLPSPDELSYATRLLCSLMEKHFPDRSPEWKPLPDLYGVLTQIDNLSTALFRPSPGVVEKQIEKTIRDVAFSSHKGETADELATAIIAEIRERRILSTLSPSGEVKP